MKRKAIRCLLILSFLTIFGLVFYVESTYSQELAGNKTKVEKLEHKVEDLSQLYEQNRNFYETVFHQQNTFLTVIVSALGIILLVLIGSQWLFSLRISRDVVNKTVNNAKDDMMNAIEKTRGELEGDIRDNITQQEAKFTEFSMKTERTLNRLI